MQITVTAHTWTDQTLESRVLNPHGRISPSVCAVLSCVGAGLVTARFLIQRVLQKLPTIQRFKINSESEEACDCVNSER